MIEITLSCVGGGREEDEEAGWGAATLFFGLSCPMLACEFLLGCGDVRVCFTCSREENIRGRSRTALHINKKNKKMSSTCCRHLNAMPSANTGGNNAMRGDIVVAVFRDFRGSLPHPPAGRRVSRFPKFSRVESGRVRT